jgi:hypothetical protein
MSLLAFLTKVKKNWWCNILITLKLFFLIFISLNFEKLSTWILQNQNVWRNHFFHLQRGRSHMVLTTFQNLNTPFFKLLHHQFFKRHKTYPALSVSGIWTCILPTNQHAYRLRTLPPVQTCTRTLHFTDTPDYNEFNFWSLVICYRCFFFFSTFLISLVFVAYVVSAVCFFIIKRGDVVGFNVFFLLSIDPTVISWSVNVLV